MDDVRFTPSSEISEPQAAESVSEVCAPENENAASGERGVARRVTSIDALRGLIVLAMLNVNDLRDIPGGIVPWWLKHHPGPNGMTWVDLIAPSYIFIVGMSIPFALGSRLRRGVAMWKILLHVFTRTALLLGIGILMANDVPDEALSGWSAAHWNLLLYSAAILACCSIAPPEGAAAWRRRTNGALTAFLRLAGLGALVYLAFAFRDVNGDRIITLTPFSINPSWWQVLGMIGWAYLISSIVFLIFRTRRVALLGCMALLLCLYAPGDEGAFDNLKLNHFVRIGDLLGTRPAIAVAGMLLASLMLTPETAALRERVRFGLLFIIGCADAAWIFNPVYGTNWFNGPPTWCLSACALAATIWLVFELITATRWRGLARPFAVAGRNILLAYLLSYLIPPLLELVHKNGWYDSLAQPNLAHAAARSMCLAMFILMLTTLLNRLGFRLKL